MDVVGNELIATEYDKVKVDDNGVIVTKNGKVGRVNFQGQHIIPMTFDEIKSIDYDKYFVVKQDSKYGLADAKGYEILPADFDGIYQLDERLHNADAILTAQDNKMNLYDYLGNKLSRQDYGKIDLFLDNIFLVNHPNDVDKVGLMDVHGNELLPMDFDGIEYAGNTNQAVWINKDSLWWLIKIDDYNQNGKTLSDVGFDWIDHTYKTQKGLLAVRKGDKYGFVDSQGNLAIPLEYEKVYPFNEYGIAEVIKNGKKMYINIKGSEVKF